MKRAIFLDRDGVLNKEKSYIIKTSELEIFSYAKEAIDILKDSGYSTIVVTNQSAVARGLISEKDLIEMNDYLRSNLGVDDIYYCPHLPPPDDIELPPFLINCECRKPKDGMIKKALQEHGITLEGSYMVGDRASDIIMGQTMNLKTVLLNSGYGVRNLESEISPDFIFEDLITFAKFLEKLDNKFCILKKM